MVFFFFLVVLFGLVWWVILMKTPIACIFLVLVFVVKFQLIGLGGRRTLLHLSCSCHLVLFYMKIEDTFFFPSLFPSLNFLVMENLIAFLGFIWSVFYYLFYLFFFRV